MHPTAVSEESSANRCSHIFRFQSSQPHLKRFIMFDRSGVKGTAFFHPAVAQGSVEVTQPGQRMEDGKTINGLKDRVLPFSGSSPAIAGDDSSKIKAYRQVVAGAFASLQCVTSGCKCAIAGTENHTIPSFCIRSTVLEPVLIAPVSEKFNGSSKPSFAENLPPVDFKVGNMERLIKQGFLNRQMAVSSSETRHPSTFSEAVAAATQARAVPELPKTSAENLSTDSQSRGAKRTRYGIDVARTRDSTIFQENSEDIDALLSSEIEECDDDDDDVKSTGHSPYELFAEERFHDTEGPEAGRRKRQKRNWPEDDDAEIAVTSSEGSSKGSHSHKSRRRQKIKETVKALRRIVPGGANVDAALVLDKTILYVKTLRDRVHQLEASRLQLNP